MSGIRNSITGGIQHGPVIQAGDISRADLSAPPAEPRRHVLRLMREPALPAVLTIDGQEHHIARLSFSQGLVEITYDEPS
jgi:hypothetical protein